MSSYVPNSTPLPANQRAAVVGEVWVQEVTWLAAVEGRDICRAGSALDTVPAQQLCLLGGLL